MRLHNLRNSLRALLLPASLAWSFVTWARRRYYPRRRAFRVGRLSVVSVGNLHSGGSGKTPIVMEIAQRLAGLSPVIISRGYLGRMSSKGGVVDTQLPDGPAQYGDEPFMMAKRLSVPVIVGKHRAGSLELAETSGRHYLAILDDGFQHLAVARDLDILVIDADRSPEDAYCLPLGDLREPIGALRDAGIVVLTGGDAPAYAAAWRAIVSQGYPKLPIYDARRRVAGLIDDEGNAVEDVGPFYAFCGIASPERFLADLLARGTVADRRFFSDHHHYSARDLDGIAAARKRCGAIALVTTEKDWVKARDGLVEREERLLRLQIRYELPEEFWYVLANLQGWQ